MKEMKTGITKRERNKRASAFAMIAASIQLTVVIVVFDNGNGNLLLATVAFIPYGLLVCLAGVTAVIEALVIHRVTRAATEQYRYHQNGYEQIAEEMASQPRFVRLRILADSIVAGYNDGSHVHPGVDLLFYTVHLLGLLHLGTAFAIPFFVLAATGLIDFSLRDRAEKVQRLRDATLNGNINI